MDTRELDTVLQEAERALVRARLALHVVEDCKRFVVGVCGDSDGDGDCPACLTRTGFSKCSPQHWRCPRTMAALTEDATRAIHDAAEEAREHSAALAAMVSGVAT